MNRPAWLVRVWGAALGAAMLVGCSTPSINAIYSADESEVFTDDRVVGFWAEPADEPAVEGGAKGAKEPKTRYEVLKRNTPDARWYPVRVIGEDADKSGSYEMRLVRLGAHTYADLQPDKPERERLAERLGLTALPMHVIYPVILADDRMTLRPLNGAKVKALLLETPKLTPHAVRDDLVILTGDSRQVQEFFRKVVETEELFDPRKELVRAAAPAESDDAVEVPANTRPTRPGRRSR